MGEEVIRGDGNTVDSTGGKETETKSSGTDTGNTKTTSSSGRKRGRPVGSTTRTAARNISSESLELVPLKGNSSSATQKTKQKQTKAISKKELEKQVEFLSGVLSFSTNVISEMKETLQHWKFTDEECNDIAVPLANIISKSPVGEFVIENNDELSLTVALGKAVIPRTFSSFLLWKEEKEKNEQNRKDEGTDSGSN